VVDSNKYKQSALFTFHAHCPREIEHDLNPTALETFLSSWINFPELIDLMSLEVYKAFQLVAMPHSPRFTKITLTQLINNEMALLKLLN
jgi:hypothetical protein